MYASPSERRAIQRLGMCAGLLLRRGHFLLLKDEEAVNLTTETALYQMHRCASDPKANKGSKQFLTAQECVYDLVRDELVHTNRFFSRDLGVTGVREAVSRSFLCFFAQDVPKKDDLETFFADVLDGFECEGQVAICALVYLARMINEAKIPMTQRSAHRMILGAMLVAVKLHEERVWAMKSYANVVGIESDQFCRLEIATLTALNFKTHIPPAQFTAMSYALRHAVEQVSGAPEICAASWALVLPAIVLPHHKGPSMKMIGVEALIFHDDLDAFEGGIEDNDGSGALSDSSLPSGCEPPRIAEEENNDKK